MFKKVMRGAWSVIVAVSLFLLGAFLVPALWPIADQMIDRHKLAGLWHVEGTLEDWRFGRDGTLRGASHERTDRVMRRSIPHSARKRS